MNKKPITIDIFDFDLKQLKLLTFLGIIEFKNKNTILMEGTPIQKTSSQDRLESFSKKALLFKRKTTLNKVASPNSDTADAKSE